MKSLEGNLWAVPNQTMSSKYLIVGFVNQINGKMMFKSGAAKLFHLMVTSLYVVSKTEGLTDSLT